MGDTHPQPGTSLHPLPPGNSNVDNDSLKDEYDDDLNLLTHECYEGQKDIIVKGRLKNHIALRLAIGTNEYI
ncbi:hypothetical protein DPMN_168432 [Dreissena polymorpha]|uniref:Uncharacterized protein n=1 Tax=Dreissena polymorpha TaxID=45954 RepID=A0A9D4IX82_DREPO|nr:hypothetical protein DPMN_168432 [Dreissena polymorpha]